MDADQSATCPPTAVAEPVPIIRAAGVYEAQDLVLYFPGWRITLTRVILVTISIGVPLAFACWLWYEPFDRTIGSTVTINTIGALWAYSCLIWPVLYARKQARTSVFIGRHTEICLNEEGITWAVTLSGEANAHGSVSWGQVQRTSVGRHRSLLRLRSTRVLIIPRRFIANDGDWQRFGELLRAKAGASKHFVEPSLPLPPDQADRAVVVHGTPTWGEVWLLIRRMTAQKRRRSALTNAIAWGAILCVLAWTGWLSGNAAMWMTFTLAVAVMIVWGIVLARLAVLLVLPTTKPHRHPLSAGFCDLGVAVVFAGEASWLPWDLFTAYLASTHGLVLQLSPARQLLIPRRLFGSEQSWTAALTLVHRHIGLCTRCGYPLRGLGGPICPECGQPVEPNTRGRWCGSAASGRA